MTPTQELEMEINCLEIQAEFYDNRILNCLKQRAAIGGKLVELRAKRDRATEIEQHKVAA